MEKMKKSTGAKAPMPKVTSNATTNQSNNSTVSNLCLILFMVFLIMFLAGAYIGNDVMEFCGLGIGIAVAIITLNNNLKEEE